MKKHSKWPLILLVGFGVFVFLGLGFRVETQKQIVLDVAQRELEWMDLQGTRVPGIYGTYSMSSSRPFIEIGHQDIPQKLTHEGTITCAFYGFPENGRVKDVTLHTYVDGELQSVDTPNSLPNLLRDVDVVEASFCLSVPRGGDLTCVVLAVTEDDLCYRHTVLEKNEYEFKSNTKTDVYTVNGEYLKTIA